jgi:DNA-binding XRE family transcriptional regulator
MSRIAKTNPYVPLFFKEKPWSGADLKEFRVKYKFSQGELAKVLGMSTPAICKMESDAGELPLRTKYACLWIALMIQARKNLDAYASAKTKE